MPLGCQLSYRCHLLRRTMLQVKMHKEKMDTLFKVQQEKALEGGYVHDVVVEFEEGEEDAGWDSD